MLSPQAMYVNMRKMVKLALKVFFLVFVIQFYPLKGELNPIKKFTISFMANKFI